MRRLSLSAALLCLLSLTMMLTACAPTLNTRGNFLESDRLQSFTKGVTTQDEVKQKLGSPTATDPFDKNVWLYIGEKTKTTSFFDPKIMARRVIKVEFDESGILKNLAEIDEKSGKEVALVDKTTPSKGQDMNIFQQFLGNLGKFNTDQLNTNRNGSPGR